MNILMGIDQHGRFFNRETGEVILNDHEDKEERMERWMHQSWALWGSEEAMTTKGKCRGLNIVEPRQGSA